MHNSYFLSGGKTGIARRLSWNEPSLTLTSQYRQIGNAVPVNLAHAIGQSLVALLH